MGNKRDIDKIIDFVRQKHPEADIWQLEVKNPYDDNGIWYFRLPANPEDDIQIENSKGQCPFLIETNRDNDRKFGETVREVTTFICEHLRTSVKNK